MQKLHHDSDILVEQELSGISDSLLTVVNNNLTEANTYHSDLNIIVIDSENGRAVSRAMISIDSITRTAVCNQEGSVCINSISFGTYLVDIISVGYAAQRIVANIHHPEMHEIHVQMISNI